MRPARGAVITGIGLVTPVGTSPAEVADAVCVGRSGLRAPPEGHPLAGVVEVAGIGPEVDAAALVPATEVRTADRYIVMALSAARAALDDAGLVVGTDVFPDRVAVIVSGVGGLATLESQAVARSQRGRVGVSPYLLPGMLPGMGAARIAIAHGITGYTSCVATACAAGAQSIAEGLRVIREDDADVVICGASEAHLFPTFADAFGNARALARGWDDPAAASRPFDRRRNGFVLSEGAGLVVLEAPAFADARGAAGYGDVAGWGATTDAHHPTTPHPDGVQAVRCMRRALADAGVGKADIGYINAHGTGTKLGDAAEVRAIETMFGHGVAVSSFKGVTGHMLGASGAVEAAVTAVAMGRGLLAPTHNLDEPDPAFDLDFIRKEPRSAPVGYALSNSFGFGGHNVSLVLAPPSTARQRIVPAVLPEPPPGLATGGSAAGGT
ncbi:MAG TPA: beta-ketoacyl-[acyl-carrier-protein] synthase family protein [Streptosporangiaceae bacterium]|nr:beta-ketoacyl-[acyl-carrier-protein] synthase family protein [Streptosporangiaceae bacterium]